MRSNSNVFQQCEEYRRRLEELLNNRDYAGWQEAQHSATVRNSLQAGAVDVLITPCEINEFHGTGVLVKLIFGSGKNFVSVRTHQQYEEHDFGWQEINLVNGCEGRLDCYRKALQIVNAHEVRRILCIPWYEEDMLLAIALKDITGAPMAIYVMDDQSVHPTGKIPRATADEAFSKADLRLSISPEMRDDYETQFRKKFWLLPPVVAPELILKEASQPAAEPPGRGLLVGHVWGPEWISSMRQTVRDSGIKLDWYGKLQAWYGVTAEELAEDGIESKGFVPAAELAEICRRHPYVVVPTGSPEDTNHGAAVCAYSIPSRMPFLMACTGTPMLVLGSSASAAAGFVRRFGIGEVCPYEASALRETAGRMAEPGYQATAREAAFEKAGAFSASGISDWVWNSLKQGSAADERFEEIMPRDGSKLVEWVEPPPSVPLYGDFNKVYFSFRRLKRSGFNPDFVLDVGASGGIWSHSLYLLFPKSRFILVDPLKQHYIDRKAFHYTKTISEFEHVTAAASNEVGRARFQVSDDLYGSSLLTPGDSRDYESIEVEVLTVDELAKRKKITGRGVLKIDVQHAEHLVLEGAKDFISQVDSLVLELSLYHYTENSKIFLEMLEIVDGLGFRYFDDAGDWRSPLDGSLLQKDCVFVRKGLYEPELVG